MDSVQKELHQIADIDPKNVVDGYKARDLAALSDAALYREVCAIVAKPPQRGMTSFTLHAPLEVMARYGLIRLADPSDRELARLQMVVSASVYGAGVNPLGLPAAIKPFPDLTVAAAEFAHVQAGRSRRYGSDCAPDCRAVWHGKPGPSAYPVGAAHAHGCVALAYRTLAPFAARRIRGHRRRIAPAGGRPSHCRRPRWANEELFGHVDRERQAARDNAQPDRTGNPREAVESAQGNPGQPKHSPAGRGGREDGQCRRAVWRFHPSRFEPSPDRRGLSRRAAPSVRTACFKTTSSRPSSAGPTA